MEFLFLAFANSEPEPLLLLKEEDEKVYGLLSRRAKEGHFSLHRDSTIDLPKLAEYLILLKDHLSVFLFSGHAGPEALSLVDDKANALGIAGLLGQCPKLKLVVLNGCSTEGQVERLLQLESQPVIIATNAPIEDRAATQFSISFFQTLSEEMGTVAEAFEAGLAAAKTVAAKPGDIVERRGIFQRASKDPRAPVWGIYSPNDLFLQWRLPTFSDYARTVDYVPNVHLVRELVNGLAPFSVEVNEARKPFQNEWPDDTEITEEDTRTKTFVLAKKKILGALPHPISEQLRKLMVEEQADSDHTFYDKLGHDRLKQISITYSTEIELVAFILLAQLWDAMEQVKSLHPAQRQAIQHFFQLDHEGRIAYEFLPLIETLRQVFSENGIECFLSDLDAALNEECIRAFTFMETLRRKLQKLGRAKLDKAEADQLCIVAEEKLAVILRQFGFFAQYVLVSIQNIDVIKYRHNPEPLFGHKLVKFEQLFTELAVEEERMSSYLDTCSVLLWKAQGEERHFLNLSPFIIDENAFDSKASLAKLYFFQRYQKDQDAYAFKHIYKPDDFPLVVTKQKQFRVIKEQFEAFAGKVLNESMKAL